MILNEKLRKILNKLIELTENKKAFWQKRSDEEAFQIIFNNGKIVIRKRINKNFIEVFDLMIYNNLFDLIDKYHVNKGHDEKLFLYLEAFYNCINRVYYKSDEVIQKMITELLSNKTVGIKIE